MSMNKEQFDQLAEGMLFMSETDAPLTYYEIDPERSKQWPPSTGRDLRPGNEDRETQVAALQKAMTGELRNLEGFRVGEIQIKIFVLGKDDSGKVAGLQTLSVET
jgi:hypothetical protein